MDTHSLWYNIFLNSKIAIEQKLGHNCQSLPMLMLIHCFSTNHAIVIAMYAVIIVARDTNCTCINFGFSQNVSKSRTTGTKKAT